MFLKFQEYYQSCFTQTIHTQMDRIQLKILITASILAISIHCRCSFEVGPNNVPVKVDKEPHMIEGMSLCTEYNGQMGCCGEGNDNQQVKSYGQIDGIFGSQGGQCDICAVNLKRFWCEYACSPKQSEFLEIQDGYYPVVNPKNPDQILQVQKVKIRVEANTACDLFNACSRNQFVSSVSAMSSPAGFLTFQGHNAAPDALQYMEMEFTYNKSNSIYFGDDNEEESGKQLDQCNRTIDSDQIHGFPVYKNCSCNHCESSCKNDDGFVYSQSGVLEDFNYALVAGVWATALGIAGAVTIFRKRTAPSQISDQLARKSR